MALAGYTDLFAAGLGLDISGACLLAKGLLTKPGASAKRIAAAARSPYVALNVRWAEDYADGKAGVFALVSGFVFQAVGYAFAIGGVSAHTRGLRAAVVAVTCTLVAVLLVVVLWRAVRWRWTRRWLLEQARWDNQGTRNAEPDGKELVDYAKVLGKAVPSDYWGDEGLLQCAQRVWGVERVRVPWKRDDHGQEFVLGPGAPPASAPSSEV